MQSRIHVGHKHRKTYNAFNIIPLGIFVIVYSMPGNALAFESTLSISPTPKFVAHAHIERQERQEHDTPKQRSAAVLATPTPVTTTADWQPQQPALDITFADWPQPVQPTPEPTPPPPTPTPVPPTPQPPQPTPPPAPPQEEAPVLVLTGEASYYSRAGCLGCSPTLTMANGQPLNDNALTMAIGANHRHLLGRKAVVTNLATGQSATLTITDTGGFYQARYGSRVADLTVASKNAIGMGHLGQVRVEVY